MDNLNISCRISDYKSEATYINSTCISCSSLTNLLSSKEKYNHFIYLSIRILGDEEIKSADFYDYNYENLWLKNGKSFYFYVSANASSCEPDKISTDYVANISLYSDDSWTFKNALVGNSNLPDTIVKKFFGNNIYCKFEDFGETKAVYISSTEIMCPTPPLKTNLALIYNVQKTLYLSFNGKEFVKSEDIQINFLGNVIPLFYTWIFVGLFIGIILLVGMTYLIIRFLRNKERV